MNPYNPLWVNILGGIGYAALVLFFLACLFLYLKSAYKLYLAVDKQEYTLIAVARAVGIFLPMLGVVMGLV